MDTDKTRNAVAVFDRWATQYQEKFMDTSAYHESFDLFCNSIPAPDADILEIACGPGNITSYLLRKRPGFRILCTDLSPNMLALAAANNPSAGFRLMDARAVAQTGKQYDGIMCGFVLPYFSPEETAQFIRDAATALKPGGILYLSTMEDDPANSGLKKGSQGDEIFMQYYLGDNLKELLHAAGFNTLDLQRIVTTDSSGKPVTDVLLLAEKK